MLDTTKMNATQKQNEPPKNEKVNSRIAPGFECGGFFNA